MLAVALLCFPLHATMTHQPMVHHSICAVACNAVTGHHSPLTSSVGENNFVLSGFAKMTAYAS